MGGTLEMWYGMVIADTPKTKELLSDSQGWVDVRDVALAHVLALEKDAAGGQRIFAMAGARYFILIYPLALIPTLI
jgi:nucleoside-diphosphate-sugar epimerase